MGIYFDYFRAADDDAAIATKGLAGGPLNPATYDGFSTKGVFPDPHLEELLALSEDRAYERGPQTSERLWPPADTPPPSDESSPWLTDPGIERLTERVRDGLAAIDPVRVADLATQWAVRQWGDYPPEVASEWISGLTVLARAAAASGENVYCWSSL
ncbi:hypothetical protein [Pedococcus sp. P5_B7]